MMQSFEDVSKAGKEFMDSGLKNVASFSKSFQAITVEATEYSKKAFETGSATAEKLVSAKSLDKAFEIQTDYAKQADGQGCLQALRIGCRQGEVIRCAQARWASSRLP